MNNKAAQAYFQTRVNTTDQGQLLIMLYDGALNYLQQARDKMLAKDFAGKGILISKVIDIVNELSSSLNMERGGSLAANLNNLYVLCTARLLQANLKMDVESLDSVVHILSGLRGAYAQIIGTPEARKAAADIASRMQPTGSSLKTSQPLMNAPLSAVPRSQARAAYGRSAAMQMQAMATAVATAAAAAAPTGGAHVQQFVPPANVPPAPAGQAQVTQAPFTQAAPQAAASPVAQGAALPRPQAMPGRLPGAYGKNPY